jgi:hypothetical protein
VKDIRKCRYCIKKPLYKAINNCKTTETAAEKFIARFSCHLQLFLLDGRVGWQARK